MFTQLNEKDDIKFSRHNKPIQSYNLGLSPLKIDLTTTNNIDKSELVDKSFELFMDDSRRTDEFELKDDFDIISTTGLIGLGWKILAENMLELNFDN